MCSEAGVNKRSVETFRRSKTLQDVTRRVKAFKRRLKDGYKTSPDDVCSENGGRQAKRKAFDRFEDEDETFNSFLGLIFD